MATSIGFTSSQVFVMLSVATYIMLGATGSPVLVRTDRSTRLCNTTRREEMYDEITDIVSYTLLLVNTAELGTISAC